MLTAETIATAVTALAAAIAKDRSTDEISLLAAIFTQLGDTLSTIAQARGFEENNKEKKDADF